MNLKDYINDWTNAPSNQGANEKSLEVLLFRAMMDYYKNHPYCIAAVVRPEETHKHYVYPGASIQHYCEISDILFAVFSRQHNNLRMTHLQAKRQYDNMVFANSTSFVFGVDPLQYDLLHGRLPFRNRGKSNYPEQTLCNPIFSDSISSYGVFYKDAVGQYNFAYEIASWVHRYGGTGVFDTLITTKSYCNKLYHRTWPSIYDWFHEYTQGDCCAPHGELLSTMDIHCFEDEMSQCHVGSLVRQGNPISDAVVAYVAQIFDANYNDMSDYEKEVVDAFREYIRTNDFVTGDIQIAKDAIPGSIVLIDSDKDIKKE